MCRTRLFLRKLVDMSKVRTYPSILPSVSNVESSVSGPPARSLIITQTERVIKISYLINKQETELT